MISNGLSGMDNARAKTLDPNFLGMGNVLICGKFRPQPVGEL